MGWFGPSGYCSCCESCVYCEDYGTTLCFDIIGTAINSTNGYANAIAGPSVATPVTLRRRWAYWSGATTLFNQSGSLAYGALDLGGVPPDAEATVTLSSVNISIWLSGIVASSAAKPAASAFYEYQITLTPKFFTQIFDDCGQRTLNVSFGWVAGSVTATPVAPLDPDGTSSESAITGNNGVFNSWMGESATSADCSLPLQADDLATGSDTLAITTYTATYFPYLSPYTMSFPFTPTGGYLVLDACP